MAKPLQAGKLIIGAIAVSVDPTGTAAATLGVDAALQIKDWLKKTPDLVKLSTELDKAFTVEIAKPSYDKPNGIRTLLPQMLEASQPSGDDIAHSSMEATLIFDTMQAKLTEPEHKRPENLMAFHKAILPLLEQACNDPRLEQALRPALTRAHGKEQRKQSATITKVLAAVEAGKTGIPLDDLKDLAARFYIEDCFSLTGDVLRKELRLRADEFRALKIESDAIPEAMRKLAELKKSAQDAIDRIDLEEAERLLSLIHKIEIEETSRSEEIRARIALLRGKVEDAFRYLSAAADSFSAIDEKEPARKRRTYFTILYRHGERFGISGFRLAARMAKAAIDDINPTSEPRLWADTHRQLGSALQQQGQVTTGSNGKKLLKRAISCNQEALESYKSLGDIKACAATQSNMGNVLKRLGLISSREESFGLIMEAKEVFEKALKGLNPTDDLTEYVITELNAGTALKEAAIYLAGTHCTDLLNDSIKLLRSALDKFSRSEAKERVADTEISLASSLKELALRVTDGSSSELREEAHQNYKNSADFFDEDNYPIKFGILQNNMGNLRKDQGVNTLGKEGAKLFIKAMEHFRCALNVRDYETDPFRWARTQTSIAFTYDAIASHDSCQEPKSELILGLRAAKNALGKLQQDHQPIDFDRAKYIYDDIQAKLDALPP